MNEAGLVDLAGSSLLGADTAQIDRYIEGSYVESWKLCSGVMPRAWLKNKSFVNAQKESDLINGTGYIILPQDFYLLTAFKMQGWKKAVYEAFVQNEKTAAIQSNEYTRGSTIRPVCVVENKVTGGNEVKQVLVYYSLPPGLSAHTVEEAIYVPVAEPLQNKADDYDLQLSELVTEPLCYLSAATVSVLLGKYDIAKALQERALQIYPGLKSLRGNDATFKQ